MWTPAHAIDKREPDGTINGVIRNNRAKTGAVVDILVTAEIEAVLTMLRPRLGKAGRKLTYLRTRDGEPYMYAGLSSMFRRYVATAVAKGDISQSFGICDLKGKGATDMWLTGTPMINIQVLCGHDSATTTETYIKAMWRGTLSPIGPRSKLDKCASCMTYWILDTV